MNMRFPNAYSAVMAQLRARFEEPAPAKIQLLSGPRQVGKTTLLLELARAWGAQALYVAGDAPEAQMPGWWDVQLQKAEQIARKGKALLLIDEIHYIHNWGRMLKHSHDRITREHIPLHVAATGSSSLQLGTGARETMAGRFERLRILHWPATEIASIFNMLPQDAVRRWIFYGGYPGGVGLVHDIQRWKSYLRESIIEPAIGRDILATETIRRPALLRQLFAVCAGHPAEIVSLQKLCGQLLSDKGSLDTVAHYLHVLEEACLVAGIRKFSEKAVRQRSAPPKLAVLNQGLLVAATSAEPPTKDTDAQRWGRWIENACIAHAWNAGQNVHYWRAEPLEVDIVMDGTWGRWAVEVKTGSYGTQDLAGLMEFCRRHRAYRPLVLCAKGDEAIASNAGFDTQSWESFLLNGPPE